MFVNDAAPVRWTSRKQQALKTVAEAVYRPLGIEDLPQLEQSYTRAVLKTEEFASLVDPQQDSMLLSRRAEDGLFVFKWDEPPCDASGHRLSSSVAGQFAADLSEDNGYHGRCLVGEDGRLLAWVTWSEGAGEEWGQQVRQSLDHGATGGTMWYEEERLYGVDHKQDLIPYREPDRAILLDTIRSDAPFAGAWLMNLVASEFLQQRSKDDLILLYILKAAVVTPTPAHCAALGRRDTHRMFSNEASRSFFTERCCFELASDQNPDGAATRRTHHGVEYLIRPVWKWYFGWLGQFRRRCSFLWEDICGSAERGGLQSRVFHPNTVPMPYRAYDEEAKARWRRHQQQ